MEENEKERSQRELNEHDRLMERGAAHASRDAQHDGNAWQEPGAYTIQEARDRAAHTPSWPQGREVEPEPAGQEPDRDRGIER
jgi:hypothetical protein